jgi:hypothetical protein
MQVHSLTGQGSRLTIKQKAQRQILKSKLRPNDEAKARDDTTVFYYLVHSDIVEA